MFYTLTTNYRKEKLRNYPIYNIKKDKIIRNEINHIKDLYNENHKTDERNWRHKRKDSSCSSTETLLKVCTYSSKWSTDSMQSLSKFQRHFLLTSQSNLEKEIWSIIFPDFKLYYKISVQCCHKKTYISVEQTREPRNKCIHIWQTNFQQRYQEFIMGRNSAKALNQDFLGYSLILRSISVTRAVKNIL